MLTYYLSHYLVYCSFPTTGSLPNCLCHVSHLPPSSWLEGGGDIKVQRHQLHQDSRPEMEELQDICPVGQGIVVSSCFSNMPNPISVFMAEFRWLQPNLVMCMSFESVPLSSSLPLNEGDCPPVSGSVHWSRGQRTSLWSENYSIGLCGADFFRSRSSSTQIKSAKLRYTLTV